MSTVKMHQGAVAEAGRQHDAGDELRAAQEAFDRLKASSRQVGLDLRLASPAALALGLRMALDGVQDVLAHLDRLPG